MQITHESSWKSHPNTANSDDNRGCDDMTWFILSTVPVENIVSSFSHWITNVTVTTVTVSTVGILVGVAIYFPTYLCVCCWKSFCQCIRSRRSWCPATEQNEEFEQQPAHLTEHGNATKAKDGISYSQVTSETSPCINQPSPRNWTSQLILVTFGTAFLIHKLPQICRLSVILFAPPFCCMYLVTNRI